MRKRHLEQSVPAKNAALLTPPGRGAVAVVRAVGACGAIDEANLFAAANGKPLGEQPLHRLCFGHWGRDVVEEVVVCRTEEDALEIQCHGGAAPAARILEHLRELGCEIVSWQQQEAGRAGMFQTECLEVLSRATTLRTATILHAQTTGRLETALRGILDAGPEEARARIAELLAWAPFGLHLTRPYEVVLTGRPNVGKSSLINALLGYGRAIVFDQPGTTRDVVTAEAAFDGWPVHLADTAGLRREAGEAIEAAGIERARAALEAADCRVLLLDTSRPPEDEDFSLLETYPDAIVVAHKCDLPDQWGEALPTERKGTLWDGRPTAPLHRPKVSNTTREAIPVSSLTGEGLETLIAAVVARLVPQVPDEAAAVPVTERQVGLLEVARQRFHAEDVDGAREVIREVFEPK